MATPPVPPPPPRLFASSADRRRSLKVLGKAPFGPADFYHSLIAASWGQVIGLVTLVYLALNALFGLAYFLVGGVANTDPTSFSDAFFFSVQTFGTIGYGNMYPQGTAAEWVVTVESLASLFFTAVVTGLAFARFAKPTARVLWSKVACVSDREGVPTLIIRLANERLNHVVDASIKLGIIRAEVTKEGERVRRVIDLPLLRSTSPSFILTWMAMHPITKDSPLFGIAPEDLLKAEVEIIVTLTGLDETIGQTIHSRTSYLPVEVRYGQRFVDVLGLTTLKEGGRPERVLDLNKFHDTIAAPLSRGLMGLPEAAPETANSSGG
jgi:inward rectifier potassium channel